MILLDISPKSRAGSYIWEHALKTVYALIATFGSLFFFIMMIGYSKRGEISPARKELWMKTYNFFFVDHLEINILICVLMAVLFNLNTYIRNSKKIHIIKIFFDEITNHIYFELISTYSNRRLFKEISMNKCEIKKTNEKEFVSGKNNYIQFRDTATRIEFGRIDEDNDIYFGSRKDLIDCFSKLIELKKKVPH